MFPKLRIAARTWLYGRPIVSVASMVSPYQSDLLLGSGCPRGCSPQNLVSNCKDLEWVYIHSLRLGAWKHNFEPCKGSIDMRIDYGDLMEGTCRQDKMTRTKTS